MLVVPSEGSRELLFGGKDPREKAKTFCCLEKRAPFLGGSGEFLLCIIQGLPFGDAG